MNAAALLAELEQESKVTRRLLERVPDAHLTWRPGPKAMALGQLARHVANIPGDITKLAGMDGIDAATVNFEPGMPASTSELLPAFDAALGSARNFLRELTAETAAAPYFRCLDVPVPAVYGRSADEALFG